MKTINLQINWYLYSIQLVLLVLLYVVLLNLGFVTVAKVLVVLGAAFTMLSLIAGIFGKKYVHIDKAGFSHHNGLNTHYLHGDEIAALKATKVLNVYVVTVELKTNKQVSFPYWLVSFEEIQKAAKLFTCPVIGLTHSQVKA
ncbi:hypothetical protein L1077_19560 [Pseudoalteromonas luteoviolacea]|uniref:hypothetical protein n=1 Tax=Pseudoalteromonas luteoviolacea TaxID=43657 RepID=UPI001F3E178B|nr:hypothetical protein [Pseudoalteromonas luteoviolacea]MCF6441640.1 hypothetical protein [Pseudoalteromonas luteoviolacea]